MSKLNGFLQAIMAVAAGWLASMLIICLGSPWASAQSGRGPNCNTGAVCTNCTVTCAGVAMCASGQCKCATLNGAKKCF
jgi:hypothetical protein